MKKIIISAFLFSVLSIAFSSLGLTKDDVVSDCSMKNKIIDPIILGEGDQEKEWDDEKNISLKELIEGSEIIIAGKVVSMTNPTIQLGNFTKDGPGFSVGNIKVSKVLKGDKDLKTISLAMPFMINLGKGIEKWESPIFTCEVKGIWFLSKNPNNVPKEVIQAVREKGDYYFASTRGRYKKLNNDLIKKIISLTTPQKQKKSGVTH